jgi:hypothetical protein
MSNHVDQAVRSVLAVAADGREFTLRLAVGPPHEVNSVQWACPVSMDGLYVRLSDVAGIDSWQATQLAFGLIADLLENFIEDGGKLMWIDSREPLSLADLFPRSAKHT